MVRMVPPGAWWMSSRAFLVRSGAVAPQAERRDSMQVNVSSLASASRERPRERPFDSSDHRVRRVALRDHSADEHKVSPRQVPLAQLLDVFSSTRLLSHSGGSMASTVNRPNGGNSIQPLWGIHPAGDLMSPALMLSGLASPTRRCRTNRP